MFIEKFIIVIENFKIESVLKDNSNVMVNSYNNYDNSLNLKFDLYKEIVNIQIKKYLDKYNNILDYLPINSKDYFSSKKEILNFLNCGISFEFINNKLSIQSIYCNVYDIREIRAYKIKNKILS